MSDDLEKRIEETKALVKKERENLAMEVVYSAGRGIRSAAKSLYEKTILQYEGNSDTVKKHAVHSAVGLGIGVGLSALTGFGVIPLVALGYGTLRLYHTGKDVRQAYQEWKEGKTIRHEEFMDSVRRRDLM